MNIYIYIYISIYCIQTYMYIIQNKNAEQAFLTVLGWFTFVATHIKHHGVRPWFDSSDFSMSKNQARKCQQVPWTLTQPRNAKGQLFLLTPVGSGTINCPDLDQCPTLHESCARKTWTSVLRPFQPANSGHASWKVDRNFPVYGSIGAVLKLGYPQN